MSIVLCYTLKSGYKMLYSFYSASHLCARTLGHGPSFDIVERRSSAGVFGHHPGDVDPPEGVAAFRSPNAP